MTGIQAVVFDMDGVLIDAKDWHYEALNRALDLFGYAISRYDHVVTYDGLPTRRKLEMLTRERGLPARLHPFLNELKQTFTSELAYQRCKPLFQHEFALSRLQGDGYLLGVASNSVRQSIDLMMERSRLTPYLSVVVSNEDVVTGKPDPAIYRECFSLLGVEPQACLVVEDHELGVAAAQAAGAHVLRVGGVYDVTYEAITRELTRLQAGST